MDRGDPLTGYAESVGKIFKKIQDYHDKRQWDYVVAITDLPMFHNERVLALDINKKNGAAVFLILLLVGVQLRNVLRTP